MTISIVLSCSAIASAQDAPKAELYGGYSALFTQDFTLHGFQASVAGNANKWFGVVAEFGVYYHSDTRIEGTPENEFNSTVFTYLFGPRFSHRGNGRVTPFAQALVGGVRFKAEVESDVVNVSESANGFGMALGGGVDVKLADAIAIRVIQGDYFLARFQGQNLSNARISAGIVVRFN